MRASDSFSPITRSSIGLYSQARSRANSASMHAQFRICSLLRFHRDRAEVKAPRFVLRADYTICRLSIDQEVALMSEKRTFAIDAGRSAETSHTPIGADDAVAGDHHRHGIAP